MYFKKLRDYREDNDYTQEYIAKYLKIKQESYHRYESGKQELPIRHLKKLCKLYKCKSVDILEF